MMREIPSETSMLHKMILDLHAELAKELSKRNDEFLAYMGCAAEQAEVIKAQRANLDAAQKAMIQVKTWLEEVDMTYAMHNGVRTENAMYRSICAALEGVEPEEK